MSQGYKRQGKVVKLARGTALCLPGVVTNSRLPTPTLQVTGDQSPPLPYSTMPRSVSNHFPASTVDPAFIKWVTPML